ncbi:MAG TPA: FAD-binding oxidoreductase [Deltaproteobacteria bacterium]|nr:FAD-binding oxidoreductase [Deltaproteobacteria bacterium]HPR55799.1 FAD-binding oxidoreductase [Deltaproteobacteria bacterium]HXK46083.1 FAD-binding oxidoreductase [Deltaproteobacteria bacterium]
MPTQEALRDQANTWKVVRVQPESHDTNSLFLEGSDEKFLKRRAGQYASIRVMGPDGWSEPHPFTISCAPEDVQLRFTIKKAGNFTSAIPDLRPGTTVKCVGPLGTFCKDIDAKPSIVLLAGGVGITPFLSVLRHFRNIKAENKVVLFWSNKTIDDVFCADEIGKMSTELNLKVIHNLSRDEDAARHYRDAFPDVVYEAGRLSADILRKYGVSAGSAFYLCGPPPMMESALQEVSSLGVDPETVEREKFSWK